MALEEQLEKLKNFNPSDLDPDNIGAWPLPVKIAIWGFVFVLVVLASHRLVIQEKTDALVAQQQQEEKLKTEFEKKVQDAANLEKYRAQMEEMKESFTTLLSQLPKETEVPALLDDISKMGVDSGLSFKSIDLKPEKKAEFYVELPIDVKVVGGYHDFGSFVSSLAGLPRIVTLHDFVIQPSQMDSTIKKDEVAVAKADKGKDKMADSAAESRRANGELSMLITLKTYRYKSEADKQSEQKDTKGKPTPPAAAPAASGK